MHLPFVREVGSLAPKSQVHRARYKYSVLTYYSLMQSKRMNQKGPRRLRRGGRKQRGGGGASILQPPPFIPTMKVQHRFRFVSGTNSATGLSITRKQLLNLVLYTPTAITSVRLFEAVRLRKVMMWANPTALGAPPNTLQIEWFGENSPSVSISDTGMGIRPAHVSSAPPASSSNRWWSMTGSLESDQMFALTFPANTVIDVILDCRLVETELPTAGDVPAGAVIGQLYGDYLDGLASGLLSPIGYTVLP